MVIDCVDDAVVAAGSPNASVSDTAEITEGREKHGKPIRLTEVTSEVEACSPDRRAGSDAKIDRPPMLVSRSNVTTAASATSRIYALVIEGASTNTVSVGRAAGSTISRIMTLVFPGLARMLSVADDPIAC